MVPIVAGLLMGAAMGGGIAALQKKDILQGALMGAAGGALGGAFMPGVAAGSTAAAEGALSGTLAGEAGVQSLAQGSLGEAMKVGALDPVMLESGTSGLHGAAMEGGAFGFKPSVMTGAVPATTTPGMFSGGIGNFLSNNKYALAGGALGGMMAPGQEPDPADQGNIRDYTYSQEINPEFGSVAGAPYFKQRYTAGAITPVEDYTAANGGIVALAEGGKALELPAYRPVETQRYATPVSTMTPEVAAYNQQMMERANQQYNINRRPLPIQVPGSPGYIAPTANAASALASTGEFGYDPVTRRYTGIGGLAAKEKSELEKMREELDMMRGGQSGNSFAAGDSGNANGGMISSYADGGLSSLGAYSDGGQLLKGPGDGVSDDIPARIGARQPARLADGEFVVPARVVSELGNGSTDAGAKRLYAMMDRVQNARKKSVGKGKVAVDSKAHKMLPA